MFSNTFLELIEFFTRLIWIMTGFIAGLLLINLGVVALLCYTEVRSQGGKRR